MPHGPATPSPFRFTLHTTRPDNDRNPHPAQSQKPSSLVTPASLHHAEPRHLPFSSEREYVRQRKSQQFARTPRFAYTAASPLASSRTDQATLGHKHGQALLHAGGDVSGETNFAPVQNHDRWEISPDRQAEIDELAAGQEQDEDEEMLDRGVENDDEEEALNLVYAERDVLTEARNHVAALIAHDYTPTTKRRRIRGPAAMDSSAWAPTETPCPALQCRPPSPPTSPNPHRLPDRTTPTRIKPPTAHHPHTTTTPGPFGPPHFSSTAPFAPPHFHPTPRFAPFQSPFPTNTTSTPSTPCSTSHHPRHKYILPTPDDPRTPAPTLLPDAFSPHRRKERFVPHGWASTLRGWIVEASSSSSSSSTTTIASSDGAADDGMAVGVEAVSAAGGGGGGGGGGVISLMRAAVVGETRRMVNVVLVGEGWVRNGGGWGGAVGGGVGGQRSVLGPGMRVQLRGPLWDVWLSSGCGGEGVEGEAEDAVRGKIWVVCASWRVLLR